MRDLVDICPTGEGGSGPMARICEEFISKKLNARLMLAMNTGNLNLP